MQKLSADSFPDMPEAPEQPETNFYSEDTIKLREKKTRGRSALGFTLIIFVAAVVLFFIFSAMFRNSEGFGGLFGGVGSAMPEDAGDISEINISNAANRSGVTEGEDCCFVIGGGGRNKYEIRKYPHGSNDYETIYSSDSKISDLGYYDGVFWFLAPNGSKTSLYTYKEGDAEAKTRVASFDIDALYIYGSHAYYVVNGYGESRKSGILNRIDMSTGKDDIITSIEDVNISTVMEYRGYLYIHYTSKSNYSGHIKIASLDYPNALSDVSVTDTGSEDIYGISAANGRVFVSNMNHLTQSRETYSMRTDGGDVQRISGSGGTYLCAYGDYVFYTVVTTDFRSMSYTYETRRMNSDGNDDVLISVREAINPGIADRKMFYTEPEYDRHAWMTLDGYHEGQ